MDSARYVLSVALIWSLALSGALAAPTLEEISARIADVERRPVEDPSRELLLQLNQQAKSHIEAQAASVTKSEKLARTLAIGPSTVKELGQELTRFNASADTPLLSGADLRLSLADLQQVLEVAVAERASLETKLGTYDSRARALVVRPAELVQEKNAVSARIGEIQTALAGEEDSDVTELAKDRRRLLEAEMSAELAELEALNQEQLSHGIRVELNESRRRLAEARKGRAEARVNALEQLLLDRRQEELRRIREDANKAERDMANAEPLLRELAKENADLSEALAKVLDDQAQAVRERVDYTRSRQQLNDEFERARQRALIAGASSSLGRILVDQRRRIPELGSLRRLAKLNEANVSRVGLARIEIDEKQRAASGESEQGLTDKQSGTRPLDAEENRQAQALYTEQRKLLTTLDENYASYLRMLDATDYELQQLTNIVATYQNFLDERLLWLPNTPPLSRQFVSDVVAATQWYASPSNWYQTLLDIVAGVQRAWLRLLIGAIIVVAIVRSRLKTRAMSEKLAAAVGKAGEDNWRHTLLALLLTTWAVLPFPLGLWMVSDLLTAGYAAAEFSVALGQLSSQMAALFFAVFWVRAFLARTGVAIRHFGWPENAVASFRSQWLRWGQIFVPAYAIASTFDWASNPGFQYSFRRLFFLAAMVIAALFTFWCTKREGVIHHEMALRYPASWLTRSRPVWAFAATSAPLLLALLSAFGYHYTALELSRYYLRSVLLLISVAILHHLALRWLSLARERIAGNAVSAESAHAADDLLATIGDEARPDLAIMNAQARLVIRNISGLSAAVALFWIWQDVLPALTVFDKITLWQVEIKDSEGISQFAPITIANAALAAVILAITMLAARNVPGVLEIALLQRLRMHHGSRYAVNTLAKYFIVALGVTLALGTIGLRWSQVQWLIAALGVGLGFGLQEIFANFVSGLILLFERPVRAGDVVTIGDLTGCVSRIQIRATTIVDADNKEIIVPNKTFITERFVNWTLTDQVTRIVIDVGVAYGSNVEQVTSLMLDIAAAHPKVLKAPAPAAVFRGFGDSALNFQLGVYAREVGDRIDLRHELNSRIYSSLGDHGIEIPYPQSDVRIRSMPSLEFKAPNSELNRADSPQR